VPIIHVAVNCGNVTFSHTETNSFVGEQECSSLKTGDMAMLNKTLIAFTGALVLGSASVVLADVAENKIGDIYPSPASAVQRQVPAAAFDSYAAVRLRAPLQPRRRRGSIARSVPAIKQEAVRAAG
jgi:hypothetical protein